MGEMASVQQITLCPQVPQKSPPSLRTNFKWTFAGSFIYALCQWGMLSVLAKAGSASIVGQFALGLAISAPVFMFANLQLRAVQATDVRREYRFADYFTLRILTTTAGFGAIACLVLALPLDKTTRGVVLLVALAKSVECISDVIAGLLQMHERLDQVASSFMIRGPLSILAFGVIFLSTHSLIDCVGAICLARLTVVLGYDVRRAKEALLPDERWFRWDWRASRRLFLLSLPLGLVMMLISLDANIPRYLLERFSGSRELGIFASLAYLLVAVSMIVSALGQSATVRLSSMFAECDFAGFKRLMVKLGAIGIAIMVLGLAVADLWGRILLTLLYRPEYGEHTGLLLILMAAAGAGAVGSFIGYGLTAARCFRSQVPLIATSTLISAGVAALLVPRYGSIGAALGVLASAFTFALGAALLLICFTRNAMKQIRTI
jgi:O-antigen/teichoic acid export membrane protein